MIKSALILGKNQDDLVQRARRRAYNQSSSYLPQLRSKASKVTAVAGDGGKFWTPHMAHHELDPLEI